MPPELTIPATCAAAAAIGLVVLAVWIWRDYVKLQEETDE